MEYKRSFYDRCIKRSLDFLLSLFEIILLSPLLLFIAVLVRAKLGGPVIFKQRRPGLNENVFTMYKFRTMTDKRDATGKLLPDEARITRFGNLLRSTSLDELPELFNILKGDMAIVGPRPLLVQYLPLYNEQQHMRHLVRPGITGYAQVNGRNSLSWEEKFELDQKYVMQIGIKLDISVIVKTFLVVFRRQGINSDNAVTMEEFKGNEKEQK